MTAGNPTWRAAAARVAGELMGMFLGLARPACAMVQRAWYLRAGGHVGGVGLGG